MESYVSDRKYRYYGRIEEIWELNYSREKVSMFRVRWARLSTIKTRPILHHHGFTRSRHFIKHERHRAK